MESDPHVPGPFVRMAGHELQHPDGRVGHGGRHIRGAGIALCEATDGEVRVADGLDLLDPEFVVDRIEPEQLVELLDKVRGRQPGGDPV